MNWYCDFAPGHPVHGPYHDTEYGFPLGDETLLFERLALEIFQPGLSWDLILKKRPTTAAAFAGFRVDRVAAFGKRDEARLLKDSGIIRNRLKVRAIIDNAAAVKAMRGSHGGFAGWLAAHHPRRKRDWVTLFRATFKFMGPEVVNEFLMSVGYLPGGHRPDCPVFAEIEKRKPPWLQVGAAYYRRR
jgi:DNA-3-methyladenine glycosylase I